MTARLSAVSALDVPELSELMVRAFDPRFGEAWSSQQLAGALAVPDTWAERLDEDGVCVGFALVRRILDEAELMLVAVVPEARGRGLGRRLLDAAMTGARLRGARKLFLEVRDGNIAAAALYRSAGFVEVGRRKDYYTGTTGERFDAVTMQRDLDR